MRYHFAFLLSLCLLASVTAQAQLITDPGRAAAARDTLLREAERVRLGVAQVSNLTANARVNYRKRVVVAGLYNPALLPADQRKPGPLYPGSPVVRWRHVTRYRRNGRVQEQYRLTVNGNNIMRERRLNGVVTWLVIPAAYSQVAGTPMRHRGFYLRSGYVRLDNDLFALPQPLQ